MVLYSGGAKGVDIIGMHTAIETRGTAVGVLADSLEKQVRVQKEALSRGDLCLVTPYSPNAGFPSRGNRSQPSYLFSDRFVIPAQSAEVFLTLLH